MEWNFNVTEELEFSKRQSNEGYNTIQVNDGDKERKQAHIGATDYIIPKFGQELWKMFNEVVIILLE